jgi:hypothetical protein
MGRRQCELEGCSNAWRGQALQARVLHQVSPRRYAALQRARRGQALPRGGLHQVCYRRHGALQRARRGQALPPRGLHHGSNCRRHAPLVMNLQFSILMAQTTDPSSWH